MLSTKLSQPNQVTLYGVAVDGITIDTKELEPRLRAQLGKAKGVVARIVAVGMEDGIETMEEPIDLLVPGDGSSAGIPKSLKDAFESDDEEGPKLTSWSIDMRDDTLLLEIETSSFEDALFGDDEGDDDEGALAIRGADGRLFVVPGSASDYLVSGDGGDALDQMPGMSIEVVEMKEISGDMLEDDDEGDAPNMRGRMVRGRMLRGRMLRGRMLRGRMLRGRMLRGRMLRGRMLRGRMLRGRMLRGRMLRGRMITSDHDGDR